MNELYSIYADEDFNLDEDPNPEPRAADEPPVLRIPEGWEPTEAPF